MTNVIKISSDTIRSVKVPDFPSGLRGLIPWVAKFWGWEISCFE